MLAPFNQIYHQVDTGKQGCLSRESVYQLFYHMARPS